MSSTHDHWAKLHFKFVEADEVNIEASVKVDGKTGVEMEALTAVSVAALTIYDMCKAMDKTMIIGDIYLVEKHGGKSGILFVTNSWGLSLYISQVMDKFTKLKI